MVRKSSSHVIIGDILNQTMISKLAAVCVLGPLVVATVAVAQPLPEVASSPIGYATVAEALQALRARPDVNFSVQNGWTIADDRANFTMWSFTPEGYPAYPAVVKRQIIRNSGDVFIKMSVLCGGTKAACDQLVVDFQKLDEQMRQYILNRPRGN